MKIIIDAMGGDHAPAEIVRGALMGREEFGCSIVLVGRGEDILQAMENDGVHVLPKGIEIAHASQAVGMEDSPATIVRDKPESSLITALNLLASDEGDAFISAGNTGALLSASTLILKRVKGIRRAALAPVVPSAEGPAMLLDAGANVECLPEYLLQFAFMGSYCAKRLLDIPNPRVGLLNIGGEPTKGDALRLESYRLLEKAGSEGRINFCGNIEGRDAILGSADVIVADGYSGNIYLKTMEGMGLYFVSLLKSMFKANFMTKLASKAVGPGLRELKKTMDYNETGGAALLGISKPVIKSHGASSAMAIRGAIKQAVRLVETDLIRDISNNIEHMKVAD